MPVALVKCDGKSCGAPSSVCLSRFPYSCTYLVLDTPYSCTYLVLAGFFFLAMPFMYILRGFFDFRHLVSLVLLLYLPYWHLCNALGFKPSFLWRERERGKPWARKSSWPIFVPVLGFTPFFSCLKSARHCTFSPCVHSIRVRLLFLLAHLLWLW